MFRFARRALTFLLLGAALTMLSAWAIHGVNFWRARAALSRPVSANGTQSYINMPGWWINDPDFAEQVGVIADERTDPRAARRAYEKLGTVALTGSYVRPIALIDPDVAWRRHRRVEPGMPATPDPYYTMPIGYFTQDRFGWAPGESFALVIHHDKAHEVRLQMSSESLAVFNVGWPLRSTQTGVHHVTDPPQRTTTPAISLTGGMTLWTNNGHGPLDRFALPLFPLWPGVALNTLVFATTLALLWHTPGAVRSFRRRRGGRCMKCGYDTTGLETCPECGTTRCGGETT